MKIKGLMISAVVAASMIVPGAALAGGHSSWPDKPIKMIIPFGPGGAADTLGRTVGEAMSKILGQQIVGENVTGAGGTVGVTALANSAPDNYTIGVINVSTTVIGPATRSNITYDPLKDFEYIAMLGGAPTVLAVNPAQGMKTLDDVVAKAKEGGMIYGSPGASTMSNLVPAKFFADLGIEVVHVPYKGAAEAVVDAVAGHIPMTGTTLSTARPQLNEGTLIAVAISTKQRHPAFPDVPTFAELGHPAVTSLTWFGIGAPAGTAPDVVAKLNAAANQALQQPEVAEKLENLGYVLDLMTPEEFRAHQINEMALFGPVAASVGK